MKLTLRIVEAWRRGDDVRRKVLRALSHPLNTKNALTNSIAKQTNKEEQVTLWARCCIREKKQENKKKNLSNEEEEEKENREENKRV